jgi:hypothetical protein
VGSDPSEDKADHN